MTDEPKGRAWQVEGKGDIASRREQDERRKEQAPRLTEVNFLQGLPCPLKALIQRHMVS